MVGRRHIFMYVVVGGRGGIMGGAVEGAETPRQYVCKVGMSKAKRISKYSSYLSMKLGIDL